MIKQVKSLNKKPPTQLVMSAGGFYDVSVINATYSVTELVEVTRRLWNLTLALVLD